jgi:hypothetical protein
VTIVHIVDVVAVRDGNVAATRIVIMAVTCMLGMSCCRHSNRLLFLVIGHSELVETLAFPHLFVNAEK